MKSYLVGGAVRDKLLNQPCNDRDWLVVGATPKLLLDQGYRSVGKDFPVFLHPETNEAYALARTEKKCSPGYTGFECHFSENVTLEQDLKRRDLTINAMAYDPTTQTLFDPYNGQKDLEQRYLRHVSEAFCEDPLRILRTARFAARFHHLGFGVHPETNTLMYQMVRTGELKILSAERVWKELHSALLSNAPHVFLKVLRACGALNILFPEIDRLYGIPANLTFHPEIDTGIHLEMALQVAAQMNSDLRVRFSVLLHDLGKGLTPRQNWPHHPNHDKTGSVNVTKFCQRWRIPNKLSKIAQKVCLYHIELHKITDNPTAEKVLNLLEDLDAFRDPQQLEAICQACEADHQGRLKEKIPYHAKKFMLGAYRCANTLDMKRLITPEQQGIEIKQALRNARLKQLQIFVENYFE